VYLFSTCHAERLLQFEIQWIDSVRNDISWITSNEKEQQLPFEWNNNKNPFLYCHSEYP